MSAARPLPVRVDFNKNVYELHKRPLARRTSQIARLNLACGNAAARTPPTATDSKGGSNLSGLPRFRHEAFVKPAFEILREPHVAALAGQLAIRSPSERVTASGAVHCCGH
jgi:hypothetical protein